MKTVWITCAVLCACGCLCSIGLFVMGRGLLDAAKRADADADAYARDTLNAVSRQWNPTEVTNRLAPTASAGLADSVIKTGKPLGALKSATPFVAVGNGFFVYNGVKTSRIKTGCQATFENGTARVELTVSNNGSGWQLVDFQFNPAPNDSRVESKP